MDDLTGRLLIASPREGIGSEEDAEGDVFDRSVVLVLHHDDDGAHGLVLNRPLAADVDSVLPGWQEHVNAPPLIFQGGPVSMDTALGLVRMPGTTESVGIKRLFGAVGLVDLDAPPLVVVPEVAGIRIFAGYAGWSGGSWRARSTWGPGSWWTPRPRTRSRCSPVTSGPASYGASAARCASLRPTRRIPR
ncbi:YqgE/AlgH family protein [Allobranchiibius sp. GilTou73]|uniref:YqgE/AlgH family protein n=1 Tax=Allobranchiibius sp. GilTou73 TaxID=2904523 RepID=UPI00351D5270